MLAFLHILWANKDVAVLLIAGLFGLAAAGYFRIVWPALIALPALALAIGIIVGDVRGFKEGASASQKIVAACMSANARNAATIADLKQANAAFANEAATQQAQAQAAVKALQAERAQSESALASAQTKLDKALHANQDAAHWAGTPVPPGIASQLR